MTGNQQTGATRNRGGNNSNPGNAVPRNNGHGNSGNGGNSGLPRNSGFGGNSGNPGNGGHDNSGMPRNSGFGGNSGNPGNGGHGNSGTPRDSGYGDSYISTGPPSGSTNRGQTRVAPPTRQGSTSDAGSAGDQDGNTVVCLCGKDARLLTVRKEGPNTGMYELTYY